VTKSKIAKLKKRRDAIRKKLNMQANGLSTDKKLRLAKSKESNLILKQPKNYGTKG
tara:strand:+ start:359 stop:526 length:168 start_codon:yes stop_codon:yes gene_type:complete